MRAPTVLALFAAVLCFCAPAHSAPGMGAPIPEVMDPASTARNLPPDTTVIPGPGPVAAPTPDTAPSLASPPPGPGAIAVPAKDSIRQPPPHPVGPPEGYRGHGMLPPGIHRPDAVVSAPVPAAVEVDTEIDEDKALEIKLKSDPEAARRYRSPRKAFFLSLMLPGAGQIYCGSWVKATFFVAAEVSLGVGWYEVAIVQAREKERQAEQYAALHWRQERYDSTWARLYHSGQLSSTQAQATAPNRESFCDAIYASDHGKTGWKGCMDLISQDSTALYTDYSKQFSVGGTSSTAPGAWSQDSVASFRSHNIKDLTAFYSVIGSQDLSTGWEDNPDNMSPADIAAYDQAIGEHATDPSIPVNNPWGISAMQNNYLAMRSRSDQLARTQKWFLGGMILNHLAAAFDAALQASRMNRELLQLQTSWLDGLGVQGGLAWATGVPDLQARVDWNF